MTASVMKSTCRYCGTAIEKVRVDRSVAKRSWAWRAVGGFYCPKSGDWHEPKSEEKC